MSNLFSIGLSGLWAAQTGVLTAGHNIANVNTPGYTRQQVVQTTRDPQFYGSTYVGTGTDVVTVRRIYSEALNQQLTQSRAQSSQADAYLMRMRDLETVLGSAGSGIGTAVDAFAAAASQLATTPTDTVARQAMLSAGESLAERLQAAAREVDELRTAAIDDIGVSVDEVNALAEQIARVNDRITLAAGYGGPTQPPNDLLDQRDQLVERMNELIGATAVRQSNGTVNVFIGAGQPLVIGNTAYRAVAVADTADPRRVQIAVQIGVDEVRIPTEHIDGGRIGANLRFLDRDLAFAENSVGRLALALAEIYNSQHHLGQDLTGVLGGDLFAAGLPQALSDSGNTGNAALALAVDDVAGLEASDYRLAYDGAQYTLTRLADGTQRTFASLPATFDGLALSVAAGTVAAGDSWLLAPYRAGAAGFGTLIVDAEKLATARPVAVATGAANGGSVRAEGLAVLPDGNLDPNLLATVTITFTGPGTFDVSGPGTGNPTGLAYTPGAAVSFNGWTLRLDGTATAGDTLVVRANSGGIGDNGNALALAAAARSRQLDGGRTSLSEAFGHIVGIVGSRAREATVAQTAQENLLTRATQARETLSGVNLDEEAAKLLRYQQAYAASGKVIAVAGSLFETLLESLGR
jgi:flagellar hook-associated protein 1 FlgK